MTWLLSSRVVCLITHEQHVWDLRLASPFAALSALDLDVLGEGCLNAIRCVQGRIWLGQVKWILV